jgi:hypothetical protein
VETDVPAHYSLLETEWIVKLASEDKRIKVSAGREKRKERKSEMGRREKRGNKKRPAFP